MRNFNAVCTEARIFSDFITQEIRIETNNGTENPKNEKAEPLSLEIKNFLDTIEGKNDLLVKTRTGCKCYENCRSCTFIEPEGYSKFILI